MVNIRRVFLNPLYLLALTVIQLSILLILIVTWPPPLPPPPPTPVTLSFLVPSSSLLDWDSLQQEFEPKNPDIRLKIRQVEDTSNALEQSYSTALAIGDSPYDLIYMDIIWVSKFAANGWLRDLSNRITKEELAKFQAGDVEGGKYENGLYRIPFHSDLGMLYYRKDWLKEFGYQPPETFEELLKISKALQEQKGIRWGFVWQARQYEGLVAMFLEVLKGYGGFWIEKGNVGLDKPEALEAVKFLHKTIKQQISPSFATFSSEQEYLNTFLKGKTVFLRSWPNVWTKAQNSPIRGKIWFKAMVHAPGRQSAACRGGWGFGIAKSAKHPEEAWRVIQFFTSEETQRKFLWKKGFLPSRTALLSKPKNPDDKEEPHVKELLEISEKSVPRPPIPKYKEASEILQCHLRDALTGALSPEEAMKAAANETNNLLTGRPVSQNPC